MMGFSIKLTAITALLLFLLQLQGCVPKQANSATTRYMAPGGKFSCELPERLPGFIIREHYEEDTQRGFVEFPTDFGMTVIYYWRLTSSTMPGQHLNQTARRELLEDCLEDVLMQGIFLPTSPDSEIMHREFVLVGEEEMLFALILVPAASGASNLATDEKFNAKVGNYLFVRDEYAFALRFQNNLRDLAPLSETELASIAIDYKRVLAEFYSSMQFE